MSRAGVTIRTYLLSYFENEFGEPNGQGVKNDGLLGEFYHPNEIIDQCYDEVFKNMRLYIEIDEQFKKEFCKRFYNKRIGFDTMAPFLTYLESYFNTKCYNLFKFRRRLMDMTEEEFLRTINVQTTGKGNQKQLAIENTSPQNDLSIIYNDVPGSGVIKYANALGENYGNSDSTSTTTGSNAGPLFDTLNYFARITPIDEVIFNICEDLFYQLY